MVIWGQILKMCGKPRIIFLAGHRSIGCSKWIIKVRCGHMGPLGRVWEISTGGAFLGGGRKFSQFFKFFCFSSKYRPLGPKFLFIYRKSCIPRPMTPSQKTLGNSFMAKNLKNRPFFDYFYISAHFSKTIKHLNALKNLYGYKKGIRNFFTSTLFL
jgi:hypothetical protein